MASLPGVEWRDEVPDDEAWLGLFETTGWNARARADAAELGRSLRSSDHVVAAWDTEGEAPSLVAGGRLLTDGVLYAVLFDVIVAPSHRGRGLGREVVAQLLAHVDSLGVRDVLLFAAEGTAAFYSALGFEERPGDAPGMLRRSAPG